MADPLPSLYAPCACCGGFDFAAEDSDSKAITKRIERLATLARQQGAAPTFDPLLLHLTASNLKGQMQEGYGSKSHKIAYNTPDFEMLRHLEQNVYSFSAAKNYQQLKDMTFALMDGEQIRPLADYKRRIADMNIKYNDRWLATERNTAVAGGQMASRWVNFESNKDDMPMLQYSTVGDGKVRDTHKALDGIIKPIDDAFWSTYYPPNGWNCRCDVIQLADTDIIPTKDEGIAQVIDPMFETNMAKAGLIFPKGHPYFDGVPKAELRKAMAYLPPENSYMTVTGVGGNKIDLHLLHGNEETLKNLAVADDLIKLGYRDIKLLPDLHMKEAALKSKFYPKGYKPYDVAKNADAWIKSKSGKNMVCDFKTLTSERSFANHIAMASKQADYAIIKFIAPRTKRGVYSMQNTINKEFANNKHLQGVIVIDHDGSIALESYRSK